MGARVRFLPRGRHRVQFLRFLLIKKTPLRMLKETQKWDGDKFMERLLMIVGYIREIIAENRKMIR